MLESSLSMSSRYWRYIRATRIAIAAKKAIVSAVSSTSSRLPPPGSTTRTSATSAMRPNFQAVCTVGTLARRPVAGGGLVDRAGRHQHQHERAQGHPVDHEDDGRVPHQVAEEPRDRRVADDER